MPRGRRISIILVYSLGVFLFYLLTSLLFRAPLLDWHSIPLHIAAVLLFLNAVSAIWANQEKDEDKQLDHERNRIGIIQEYGSYIIFAEAVVSAITGVASSAGIMFYSYLASSLVASVATLVPIWMPEGNWWSYLMVRHFKTVFLVFSVGWLAQAVALLAFVVKT
jgi:hypothetical protein